MTKKITFFTMAFLLVAGLALAQDADVPEIGGETVGLILALSIGGIGVLGLTEILKRTLLKLIPQGGQIVGYAASLIVSAAATAYYQYTTTGFEVLTFAIYTILVFATANGIFKVTHTPS